MSDNREQYPTIPTSPTYRERYNNNPNRPLDYYRHRTFGRDSFHTEFNTNAYLRDFYTVVDDPAMQMVVRLMPNIVARLPHVKRMLDFGAGPTIHVAAAFRNHADELYLADYLEQNRDELLRWWNRESQFDWSRTMKLIATMEASFPDWTKIEDDTRAKICGIFPCNCLIEESISQLPATLRQGFDIISTVFCIEYCCETIEEYQMAIKNVIAYLKPGGYFVMGGCLEETWCAFGGRKFGCLYITEECMLNTLRDAGMMVDDRQHTLFYTFDEMFLICTKKKL